MKQINSKNNYELCPICHYVVSTIREHICIKSKEEKR